MTKYQTENLQFFDRELLSDALVLDPYRLRRAEFAMDAKVARMSLPDLYVCEIPYWLQLGTDIGFFDDIEVNELSERTRERQSHVTASARARFKNLMTPLRGFFYERERARLSVGEMGKYQRARLHSIFRSHMLMTSELMGDWEVIELLSMVGGADDSDDDSEWIEIIDSTQGWQGSLDSLCRGFAHVLEHLEVTRSLASETWAEQEASQKFDLNRMLSILQLPRLGLDEPKGVFRYFQFAGAIVAQLKSQPVEIDAERTIFNQLLRLLVSPYVPVDSSKLNMRECWEKYGGAFRQSRPNTLRRLQFPS